jgi:cytidine deaminase
VVQAVAAGAGRPRAVVVVADASPPAPPCGLCRETLRELAGGDLPILLVNLDGEREEVTLGELFPRPFVLPERQNER